MQVKVTHTNFGTEIAGLVEGYTLETNPANVMGLISGGCQHAHWDWPCTVQDVEAGLRSGGKMTEIAKLLGVKSKTVAAVLHQRITEALAANPRTTPAPKMAGPGDPFYDRIAKLLGR